MTDPRTVIEEALVRLQGRDGGDSFVIFEDRPSGKFVQFAGGRGQPLLLDLPLVALDGSERERAAAFFESLGVQAGPMAYDLVLADDVVRAADVAVDILRGVFRLTEVDLRVEEN